jgi:hypothetical protein
MSNVTPVTEPTTPEEAFLSDRATGKWVKDVFRFLPLKSQFILYGNIRDLQPFPRGKGAYALLRLPNFLCDALSLRGIEHFLVFRPTEGLSFLTPSGRSPASEREFFSTTFKMKFDRGDLASCHSLSDALNYIEDILKNREHACTVILDFASRNILNLENLKDDEHRDFSRALLLSHQVDPRKGQYRTTQFNPLFWLCDKENDLPGWFTFGNTRIRQLGISNPDHVVRRALIPDLLIELAGAREASEAVFHEALDRFVDQTESMPLTDVIGITRLCRHEELPFHQIGEAVRRYKLGVTEDPWKKLNHDDIAQGGDRLRERVKGQSKAMTKALDIVKRAITGLSGSQASNSSGRPRGVLFLAGPTGTGKTELAKALTELLFGDERSYIRFDMSEFSAEHADQRLLGAPPGYVGYDAGGELTNAVKSRPFSVILFDEIEKAHPRLLDKFLQLLDDGVLTSGRGERVYFSESLIIFTSNLGIYKQDNEGVRTLNVSDEEPYEEVEKKVRAEIQRYFQYRLGRPEILNRIGENIVVFDFIREDVADLIYDKMLQSILKRLLDSRSITIAIASNVGNEIRALCTSDRSNGGRGIGNQLEVWLINPLARALFDNGVKNGAKVLISGFEITPSGPVIKFSSDTLLSLRETPPSD